MRSVNVDEEEYQLTVRYEILTLILLKEWNSVISILESSDVRDVINITDNVIGTLIYGSFFSSKEVNLFYAELKTATKTFYNDVIRHKKLNSSNFEVLYFKLNMMCLYYVQWFPEDEAFIENYSLVLKKVAQYNCDQRKIQDQICYFHLIVYVNFSKQNLKRLELEMKRLKDPLNLDYTLKEKLDYIVHQNNKFSSKALNLSCETYFDTFSNFRHSKIDRTFELALQNTLHTMKTFQLPTLNQKDFDDKFIIKKFKELDEFNRTYYEKFKQFSHQSLTFKEMVNQTMQDILISLMNRTINKILQYQNKYKNIASKISFILKKYKENAMKHICLLYTSPSPRDKRQSRMPSSA